MDKQEVKAKFEKNVEYLKRNVPKKDIYMFSEAMFIIALYFVRKLSDWEDLELEAELDATLKRHYDTIMTLHNCKEINRDIDISLHYMGLGDREDSD